MAHTNRKTLKLYPVRERERDQRGGRDRDRDLLCVELYIVKQ